MFFAKTVPSIYSKIWLYTDEEDGQTTLEAAYLLPVLMLLFGMLLQPVCIAYTRQIMQHVAQEAAHVVAIQDSTMSPSDIEKFIRSHLEAVPKISLFRASEKDWQIHITQKDGVAPAKVEIKAFVRPVPFLGVFAGFAGKKEGENICLEVRANEQLRADWVQGNYGEWMKIWNHST